MTVTAEVGAPRRRKEDARLITGRTLWTADTGYVNSTPAIADGVVYLGSFDHLMYAFRLPESG